MRINPKALGETVTIINKLKKVDSITNMDVWYKTVLHNCIWNIRTESTQNGSTTNLGSIITIQIPKAQEQGYLPYKEWKGATSPDESWTVSQNDYIVLGKVTEDITNSNITSIMSTYEPNACKIQVFEDLTLPEGSYRSGDNFLEQYANIYYVEGV